jgi:hypothetical protein
MADDNNDGDASVGNFIDRNISLKNWMILKF